jgi:hypothetical protein
MSLDYEPPRTKPQERFKPTIDGRREPGDSDALPALASNKPGVCEHSHDSAGTCRARVAKPPHCGRPIAAEVATRNPYGTFTLNMQACKSVCA